MIQELRKYLDKILAVVKGRERKHIIAAVGIMVLASASFLAATDSFDLTDSKADSRPPIVLISIDTFRADRLTAAGYERNITPNLDSFINQSYYFENAYANAPWTLSSHSTVFTGKYPSRNGALNLSYEICEREETIPDKLKEKGYTTGGFTGDGPVSKHFGFSQGFDHWNEQDFYLKTANVNKSLEFIENRPNDRFFLFSHGFDVHGPYVADSRPVKYGSNFSSDMIMTEKDIEELEENGSTWLEFRNNVDTSKGSPYLRQFEDLYDNSFIPMDRSVGRLFDEMKDEGVYDDAVIVVMGDHGEEFGEHGVLGHTQMYEETIRVPLAVKLPNQEEGHRIKSKAELRDIYPTILREVGIETENRGIALQELINGEKTHEKIFAERIGPEKKMLIKGDYKLIRGATLEDSELYNLEKDPEERNDISENMTLVKEIDQSFEYPEWTDDRCKSNTAFEGPDYEH